MNYPMTCQYCGVEIDSMDSLADTRADMRRHLELRHPDQPDYIHDPRFAL